MPKPKHTSPTRESQAKKTASQSLDELRFRRAVQGSVTHRILSTTPLPDIPPPAIEGIRVSLQVLDPNDVTDADLLDRLGQLAADNAPRRPRSAQEVIAPGDELTLNIIGYCRGAIIPFTFRQGVILEHQSGAYLPGFAEAMAGAKVGAALQINLVLPPDFGVEALRGLTAVFAVNVLGAAELLPVDLTSDEFLFGLGLGQTHEGLFAALHEEIVSERAREAVRRALDEVFELLSQRSPPQIPQTLIDEEIGRRWRTFEGNHLAELQIPASDQEAALASWLNDPTLRRDTRKSLVHSQLLLAIAAAEKLQPTREEFIEMINEGAVLAGADLKQALKDMRADPELTRRVSVEAMIRKATAHLVTHCIEDDEPAG